MNDGHKAIRSADRHDIATLMKAVNLSVGEFHALPVLNYGSRVPVLTVPYSERAVTSACQEVLTAAREGTASDPAATVAVVTVVPGENLHDSSRFCQVHPNSTVGRPYSKDIAQGVPSDPLTVSGTGGEGPGEGKGAAKRRREQQTEDDVLCYVMLI